MNREETQHYGVDCIHLAQDIDPCRALSEHGIEPPSSIEGGEFLVHLSDCHVQHKDSARS
jgi:hypothetical protein